MRRKNKKRRSLRRRREREEPKLRSLRDLSPEETLVRLPHPVTGELVYYFYGCLATDFAGVLESRCPPDGQGKRIDPSRNREDTRPYSYAFDFMRLGVLLYGADKVFIIKNDRSKDGHIADEAVATLNDHGFFEKTGFLWRGDWREEVDPDTHFIRTKHRREKGKVCIEKRGNILVEDKPDVAQDLPRNTIWLWFGKEAKDNPKAKAAVRRRRDSGRFHYVRVFDWIQVAAEVFLYYPYWQKILEGRPEEEQAEIIYLCRRLQIVV